MLVVREDDVTIAGTVRSGWFDFLPIVGQTTAYGWTIYVEPDAADAFRLIATDGTTNAFGWIRCRITPVAPYRYEPWRSQLLGELIGQRVRLGGTWCDRVDADSLKFTTIEPIAWILVDRGLSPIVEEHGFSQVIRDADVFAFSDDQDVSPLMPNAVPHHGEDRHVEISVPYPLKPQSNCNPVYAECDDREPAEAVQYDYRQKLQQQAFPIHADRAHAYTVVPEANGDTLHIEIDTGTPAAGQGFFYAKFTLTYDEPFDKMCFPDVCLADPSKSCQFNGEYRTTYAWPRLESVRAGDMLLGPAGGGGVLGRLLGALHPTQRFDHIVLFVEDDGRTVRHCTASDARLGEEEYINGTLKVKTPVGDFDAKIPIQGLRGDVVRYGWPGSISQSLGEICITGRNRLNSSFSFGSACAALLFAESAMPYKLWQLAPSERDKRTSFHDPEATATARQAKDAGKRLQFSLTRLQKDPAIRDDVDLLWPKLVKPHPYLESEARAALLVVAQEAKKIQAHYRFFGYSHSEIAITPAFLAPPKGDPSWLQEGSDWAGGTVAAMCSSFIWRSVQAANDVLQSSGRPVIELEGGRDPGDDRQRTDYDGLYQYGQEERVAAGKQLFGFMYDKVASKIQAKVDALPGLESAVASLYGGTVDAIKNMLATTVANQMCNSFASDAVSDFSGAWQGTGPGIAASPDDTFVNWDVKADLTQPPPLPGPGKVNVYGNPMAIVIPNPGWVAEPIYLMQNVVGTGEVHGSVVRRQRDGDPPQRVVGATVRLGCELTASDPEGNWEFLNTKAGRYHIKASMFIFDPFTKVSQEWKSKDKNDIVINNGAVLSGIVLELRPPPGVAANVNVEHHADIVDRRVIGKDAWGHFDLPQMLPLSFDPRDDPSTPTEQRNTKLRDTYDRTTPAVGSGQHVRVKVDARLHGVPGPGGSIHYDGSVELDVHVVFFDGDDGETNGTAEEIGVLVAVNAKHELPYNLVSDELVPDRASGKVTIHNFLAVLPS
jgi:hypothetical protein